MDKLGDLRGAVERLREVVAAARANPDMGPAHADTTKYAGALAGWEALAAKDEAGELRFNPQSPWTCATNKGRAYYWRRGSAEELAARHEGSQSEMPALCWITERFLAALQAPAEGVQHLAEQTDGEFNKFWSTLQ
jgi:hypothetical protein